MLFSIKTLMRAVSGALVCAVLLHCGGPKTTAVTKPASAARSTDFLVRKLRERNTDAAKDVQAQARIVLEDGRLTVNANVVWLRDSAVWMAVRKFGLEAARVLVTKDSVFVLNRIEKSYSARSIATLRREYSLPDGGFDLLQHALLAQAWLLPDVTLTANIKDGMHWLYGQNAAVRADYRVAEGPFWLNSESFNQVSTSRSVSFSFEQYEKIPILGYFPMQRTIQVSSPDNGSARVDVTFSAVQVNTNPSYRFEVPAHYKKE